VRKVLFASSEVHPLMKTGGLADVSASLPTALHKQGHDVRIIMPAYRQCLEALTEFHTVATIKLDGYHSPIEIIQSTLRDTDVTLWLVNSPEHFDRNGGAYGPKLGGDWEDNAARFALFSRAIAAVAMNQGQLNWQPEILHCNDWQTGLAPALIADLPNRPATIFTIHNLAYQGLYPRSSFEALDLPKSFWHSEGLEFYDMLSFMKGGLNYSDHITTVSPTYADEICRYEFGYGLEGLLAERAKQGELTGIINGIDLDEWNPETDKALSKNYSAHTIRNKLANKTALQQHFALPLKEDVLVIGLISRLVSQKGIDLSIDAIATLLDANENIQLVCLGSGEASFEQDLRVLRARYPDKVGVTIGYNEHLAHQIEAGSDVFLMPSRFEPCGLNQLYSLRYGTLPIVRNTGGLADSVVDASGDDLKHNLATGFKFEAATAEALEDTLLRAVALFRHPRIWRRLVLTAMEQDYSWEKSAQRYHDLYHQLS
jgi:starch synthase